MDRHFRFAEPREQRAADRRLRRPPLRRGARLPDARPSSPMTSGCGLLPFYLQQLEMESNGKSVTKDGKPVDHPTAPVTWGGTGTDAQHAVFQLLHQGTVLVPVEFVAVREGDDAQDPGASSAAAAQCLRPGCGADGGPTRATIRSAAIRATGRARRSCSTGSMPRSLGALIAFYEHRTFANAVLLGINPFDQFGVELGKQIARQLSRGDADEDEPRRLDPGADGKGMASDGRLRPVRDRRRLRRRARGARVAPPMARASQSPRSIRSAAPASSAAACPRSCSSTARISPRTSTTRRCSAGTCRQKRFDWPVLRDNVLAEVARLEGAYTDTLTNHDVTIFHERATLTGPNSIRLASGKEVTADKILIATGRPAGDAGDRGHRACDQLERGVPPRHAAEADRHRRRRLYRQRVRRHLPPVRNAT